MLTRLHDLVEAQSQFIIATHAPIIMAYPNAQIYVLSDSGLEPTDYEATEHYKVSKRFLENRDRMLRTLFGNE
jgi:predicted ATPase